ncbi:arsenate reductase (glutaredoxin) [Polaromonas sp. C04]|uniref:arsenate reductase (glutaredoxin) n=1 Tax=Polaromonas sp. C04 TaxID=1945857 RepID=UPI000987BD66|nr:arsenate reductase (glutaredoxin) [Polaromonas sp. C04]OOG51185.1 arsenate reductase (glutaredoxin) [Polaromonas sp. C04]
MFKTTIYHNTSCGTSRNTLSLIRDHGIEPEIIEYMKTLFTKERLQELLRSMRLSARDLLRTNEEAYRTLDLASERWSDDELVDFMISDPSLINRPIVTTSVGTRLCRPPETVLEILK